jgi:hypothetical protein
VNWYVWAGVGGFLVGLGVARVWSVLMGDYERGHLAGVLDERRRCREELDRIKRETEAGMGKRDLPGQGRLFGKEDPGTLVDVPPDGPPQPRDERRQLEAIKGAIGRGRATQGRQGGQERDSEGG